MFLTKKGFRKVFIMAACYLALGSICILLAAYFEDLGIDSELLCELGVLTYLICVPICLSGYYSEGKGKLILLGGKLVQKELKPAEFIKEYESLRNSDSLVINKPSVDVLTIAATAYDSLDDKVNVLKTSDEMIAVASEKKLAYATLLKASVLYSHGRIDEAEKLFAKVQKMKCDIVCSGLIDITLKSDRAMAMGDYEVAETYYLKLLERRFPKLDNLTKLVAHHQLGEVYEKMNNYEKAALHYQYCANNGGETAIKLSATQKLQRLK